MKGSEATKARPSGGRKGVRNEWPCRDYNVWTGGYLGFARRARRMARGSCISL